MYMNVQIYIHMYIQVQQQAVDSDLTHYVESEVMLSVTDPSDPQAPPWPPDNLVFINRYVCVCVCARASSSTSIYVYVCVLINRYICVCVCVRARPGRPTTSSSSTGFTLPVCVASRSFF